MAVETLSEETIKVEKCLYSTELFGHLPLSMSTCLRHWEDLSGLTTLIYAMAFYLTESASWYALLVSRLER